MLMTRSPDDSHGVGYYSPSILHVRQEKIECKGAYLRKYFFIEFIHPRRTSLTLAFYILILILFFKSSCIVPTTRSPTTTQPC
jgi:hypothetical protein